MRKLDGKVALVTGASKGIGAGIALSLAKEGAVVAVNYASDRNGADRVVEKIKAAGGKAIAVQGSVTSSEDIDQTCGKAIWRKGRLHHQHRLGSKHSDSSRIVDLRGNEECGGRHYPCAREGTWTAEHPRELHQPWRNRHRGCACHGNLRASRKRDQSADSAGSNRHARRHRVDRCLSRIRRSPVAHRRDRLRKRRAPLKTLRMLQRSHAR